MVSFTELQQEVHYPQLKVPKGQEIFRKLVKESDIDVEKFRPGTLERWNIGYDRLKSVNEGLILVRVSRPDPTRTGPNSAVWRKLSGESATSRVIPTGLPPEWKSASAIRWPEPLEP